MPNFAAFLSYVIVSNVSPGPNAVLSMSNAGKYGLRRALRFNLGIAAGVFFLLLLCGAFSLTILTVFPQIQPVMIWAGAGYILWLAWNVVKSRPEGGQQEEAGRTAGDRLFLHGALLQFVNPNSILYGISVFATFIIPNYRSPAAILLFCAFLSLAALAGTGCWTLFGSFFHRFVGRHVKAVNLIMALLLVCCAVSLII
ncbi:LysE family transporter [Bacilliculturomica massiliensis]|uniref:LysE family transporter n=1 Tax=Bacilliculturomica massiliensis TaxID=1917867 RepID=UPI001031071A|nr:LysE family transporter [Bacilliculturomica massiliensis]